MEKFPDDVVLLCWTNILAVVPLNAPTLCTTDYRGRVYWEVSTGGERPWELAHLWTALCDTGTSLVHGLLSTPTRSVTLLSMDPWAAARKVLAQCDDATSSFRVHYQWRLFPSIMSITSVSLCGYFDRTDLNSHYDAALVRSPLWKNFPISINPVSRRI